MNYAPNDDAACLARSRTFHHWFFTLIILLAIAFHLPAQTFLRTYAIPGSNEVGAAIAALPNGNIVVGGSHGNLASVSLFDALGQPIWSYTFSAPDANRQYVESVAVTPDGFIIGVGNTAPGGGSSYRRNGFAFKMAQNGTLIWHTNEIHSSDIFFDKIIAANNNTYLISCGYQNFSTYIIDVLVASVSATSGLVTGLSPRMNLHNNNLLDDPSGLAVGSNGDYYVCGRTYMNGGNAFGMLPYIIRLDPGLNIVSSNYYLVPALGSARIYPTNMISSGNDLVVLTFGDRFGGGANYTTGLFKVDTNGVLLWARDYDLPASAQELTYSLTENATGYVIVGRTFNNAMYVIQTDLNGNHLWTREINLPGSNVVVEYFGSACTFSNGLVWFTGLELQPTRRLVLGNIDAAGVVTCPTVQAVTPLLYTFPNFYGSVAITPVAETLPMGYSAASQPFSYPTTCNSLAPPNLGPDNSLCSGNLTLNGNVVGATQYLWQNGSTASTLTATTPGTYWVVASDGCCFSSDTIVITSGSASVSLGPDLLLCNGNSATLNAGAGMSSYFWNTGQTTATISVANTGQYAVTITNSQGCIGMDTVNVQASTLSVNLGPNDTLCGINSLLLNAGNAGSIYLWSNGATSQTITATNGGSYSVTVTDPLGCTATDAITIQFSNPAVNLGIDDTLCGANSLLLDAGNAGSTYLWSNGATTQTIAATNTGGYGVTVTDPFGCSATDAIALQFSNPAVNLGLDDTLCGASSFLLDAGNAGSTYLWTNGATTQTITATNGGNYTVTVTDPFGCSATDAIALQFSNPTVNLGLDDTLCGTSSLLLDAGNAGSTYLWTTGATTQTITATNGGSYAVTVTDPFGCTATDAIAIQFSNPVVNIGPDTTICGSVPYLLDAGNPWASYAWSNGANTQSVAVGSSGTISVTVTDSLGCGATDSIVLQFGSVSVLLGSDTIMCGFGSIQLNAGNPGATYLWSNGAISQSITVLSSGSYSVTVTDLAGCIGIDTLVFQHSNPSVDLGGDTIICEGSTLWLDAGNTGAIYLWSNGATSQGILATTDGNFSVTITDPLGCFATDAMILTTNNFSVSLGPDTLICGSDTLLLDAGIQGVAFQWSNGDTSQTIAVINAGDFSVTATDTLGCIASDTIRVQQFPVPQFSLGPDLERCGEDGVQLMSPIVGLDYLWSNGATAPVIFADSSKTFWLRVRTECGYTVDTIHIELQKEAQLFVPNAFTPNGDGLNDRFLIEGNIFEGYELQVFDRWGKLLFTSYSPDNAWDGLLRGSDCPEGVYFFRLSLVGCDKQIHSRGGSVTLLR